MKKILLMLTAVAAMAMTSCDNRENIQGQWLSNPVKLDLQNTSTSTATLTMNFSQDGKASMNAAIDLTEPVTPAVGDTISPYQVSVSATATIDGTWQYAKGEDDDVLITLDYSTMKVNIDPDAVTFALNPATDAQSPQVQALKQAAIARYQAMLTNEMKTYFGKFSKIEDIKASKSTLTFEIDNHGTPDEHFTMSAI